MEKVPQGLGAITLSPALKRRAILVTSRWDEDSRLVHFISNGFQ